MEIIFAVILSITSWQTITRTNLVYEEQLTKNMEIELLYDFMQSNVDNFYFLDVYSMIPYSGFALKINNNNFQNYMLLGGWISKNPLALNKLSVINTTDAYSALLDTENSYYVSQDKYPAYYLEDYYKTTEKEVSFHVTDKIQVKDKCFYIYQINY